MEDLFADAVERLFSAQATPARIRAAEAGGPVSDVWEEIHQSGFADALVGEDIGGAGLGLQDVFGVLLACGHHALPLPLGMTMLVKAALAHEGKTSPGGPMTIAPTSHRQADGRLVCRRVPFGMVAEWAVVLVGADWQLLSVKEAVTSQSAHGSLEADLIWSSTDLATHLSAVIDWQAAAAAILAVLSAGAMDRILSMTIEHANQRTQFGKPIGKLQAIQQQISIMAEQVYAVRMAAQMGVATSGFTPERFQAAMAKARTGEATGVVASIAHAVHGAMGVTEECDLQLFTRRIHEWRSSFGSESYWYGEIGSAYMASDTASSLEFIRDRLSPQAA
jgi:acyl-CoA dehydrogenase